MSAARRWAHSKKQHRSVNFTGVEGAIVDCYLGKCEDLTALKAAILSLPEEVRSEIPINDDRALRLWATAVALSITPAKRPK